MEPTAWYYLDRAQQRVGPVPAGHVRTAVAAGAVTRVWRPGMAEWQLPAALAAELGLDPGALPPAPPAMAAPSGRLSGCAIAAIVVGAMAVVGIPILGILAAIAIPAYRDYTLRAQVAGAINAVAPLRLAAAEALLAGEPCPLQGELGGDPDLPGLRAVHAGATARGCRIELLLGPAFERDGTPATLEIELVREGREVVSDCTGGTLRRVYRPAGCRAEQDRR